VLLILVKFSEKPFFICFDTTYSQKTNFYILTTLYIAGG